MLCESLILMSCESLILMSCESLILMFIGEFSWVVCDPMVM